MWAGESGFWWIYEIRLTWSVVFGPITGRPTHVYRRNEWIRVTAFQCMPARPKRIRIIEITIANPISQNRKKQKSSGFQPVAAGLMRCQLIVMRLLWNPILKVVKFFFELIRKNCWELDFHIWYTVSLSYFQHAKKRIFHDFYDFFGSIFVGTLILLSHFSTTG